MKLIALVLSSLFAALLCMSSVTRFDVRADGEQGLVPASGQYQYPFQNPDLPTEGRLNNLVSLLTLEEKIACLGTNPSVPRLGVRGSGHVEGIHGLAQGGPGRWGRPATIPTTIFPQGIGLAETWDTDILRRAGAVEGYEARYIFQ